MHWVKRKPFCACGFVCSGFYRTNYTHTQYIILLFVCMKWWFTEQHVIDRTISLECDNISTYDVAQDCMMTSVLALVIFCILHGNYRFQDKNNNYKNWMRRVLQDTYVIFCVLELYHTRESSLSLQFRTLAFFCPLCTAPHLGEYRIIFKNLGE